MYLQIRREYDVVEKHYNVESSMVPANIIEAYI